MDSRGVPRTFLRYAAGVVLLAAAYYGAAKLGQTLRYTASVSAIWPPAGLGIAALYLWGIRWWPGVLLGEIAVNGELLLDGSSFPIGSLLGQQTGNMAEVIVGALLFVGFSLLTGSLSLFLGNAAGLSEQWRIAMLTFSTYPSVLFEGAVKILLFTLIPAGFVTYRIGTTMTPISRSHFTYGSSVSMRNWRSMCQQV